MPQSFITLSTLCAVIELHPVRPVIGTDSIAIDPAMFNLRGEFSADKAVIESQRVSG
jgi:hypothetical protein